MASRSAARLTFWEWSQYMFNAETKIIATIVQSHERRDTLTKCFGHLPMEKDILMRPGFKYLGGSLKVQVLTIPATLHHIMTTDRAGVSGLQEHGYRGNTHRGKGRFHDGSEA